MNEPLVTAFMLMGVGMITVFVALLLVVMVGKGLTAFVNKYIPAQNQVQVKQPQYQVEPKKLAVITAAVELHTGGKGNIIQIKKDD